MATVESLSADLATTHNRLNEAIVTIQQLTVRLTAAETAAAAASTGGTGPAGSPAINFGREMVPAVYDGKQRTEFKEFLENSAFYLSATDVNAVEIM